jgi:hypothetical protein
VSNSNGNGHHGNNSSNNTLLNHHNHYNYPLSTSKHDDPSVTSTTTATTNASLCYESSVGIRSLLEPPQQPSILPQPVLEDDPHNVSGTNDTDTDGEYSYQEFTDPLGDDIVVGGGGGDHHHHENNNSHHHRSADSHDHHDDGDDSHSTSQTGGGGTGTHNGTNSSVSKTQDWLLRMNRKLDETKMGDLDPTILPISAVMNGWAKTKSPEGANMVEQWLHRCQKEAANGNRRIAPTTKMYTMAGTLTKDESGQE